MSVEAEDAVRSGTISGHVRAGNCTKCFEPWATSSTLPFLLFMQSEPRCMKWYHPHVGWIFLLQLIQPRKPLTATPRDLSLSQVFPDPTKPTDRRGHYIAVINSCRLLVSTSICSQHCYLFAMLAVMVSFPAAVMKRPDDGSNLREEGFISGSQFTVQSRRSHHIYLYILSQEHRVGNLSYCSAQFLHFGSPGSSFREWSGLQ